MDGVTAPPRSPRPADGYSGTLTQIDLQETTDTTTSADSSNSSSEEFSRSSATTETTDLESGLAAPKLLPLPDKKAKAKRIINTPFFSTYRRLALIVALTNFVVLGVALSRGWWTDLPALATIVLVNIFIAIIIRQQRVVNLLFGIATLTRTFLPLKIRWMLGKVYHFGGLHSGCSVSATVWFLLFTISATIQFAKQRSGISVATLTLTYIILVELVLIVVLALPSMRSRFHNSFEVSHRFLGWSVLGLVWAHSALVVNDNRPVGESFGLAFAKSPSPYLLGLITFSIALPWFYLRKVPVKVSKPSDHAIIVEFTERAYTPFPGSSSTVSLNPAVEWHSFANIPKPGQKGFRLVISRAGDWTSNVIDNPPTHFWLKGIPTAGVANIEVLFNRVLYVCTGSGIGPVLPHLLANEVPSRLFWSTRTPEKTYGKELVQEILDSSPDAVIHDTVALGKPDMVATSYTMAVESGAEAVIVISNQKLTRKVVYGMEARGIPAYGAIWDS